MIIVAIVLLGAVVGLASLLLRLLRKPIKWAFKLLLHALFGFVLLFLFDLLGPHLGLDLALTWPNAIVSGLLGIPGVVLLLVLKYIL